MDFRKVLNVFIFLIRRGPVLASPGIPTCLKAHWARSLEESRDSAARTIPAHSLSLLSAANTLALVRFFTRVPGVVLHICTEPQRQLFGPEPFLIINTPTPLYSNSYSQFAAGELVCITQVASASLCWALLTGCWARTLSSVCNTHHVFHLRQRFPG